MIINEQGSPAYQDDRYGTVFEVAGAATGVPALGFAVVKIDPGAMSPAHFHKAMTEVYMILSGNGEMVMDGVVSMVVPGDCISICPGVVHAIRNLGEKPLVLHCATSPAYDPDDDIEVDSAEG
jgi:mannose-6-phosphate isomerase-like protein (cupin superfamily)